MKDELEALAADLAACRICRDRPLGGEARRLPHEPRPVAVLSRTARVLIAGQAPGLRVHESGVPFNDPSGDRLRQWLAVDRDIFYDASRLAIVPMGFCFPGYDSSGSDLPPRRECAPLWRQRVLDAMPQVELVLAIGGYAQKWHLGPLASRSMTETVERWQSFLDPATGPSVIPLPHPSWRNTGWLKRNVWFEKDLLPVLRERVHQLIEGC